MKNSMLIFLLLFILTTLSLSAQERAVIYSQQSGNWSLSSTWLGGSIPTSEDDVEIMSGHTVTVSSTQEADDITINATDGSNYGILEIITGASLSTDNHLIIYGQLSMSDGTLNVGNSSGDKLVIHGGVLGSDCRLNISGGIINISRYFDMVSSSAFVMTGGALNINSKGGTSSTDIVDVPSGTSLTMSAGSINILNGNLGSGVALKYNPSVSTISGGSISLTNTKNYGATTITCSKNIYHLISDVGTGNILYINNMSTDSDGFSVQDFTISSGSVEVEAGEMMSINGTAAIGSEKLILQSSTTGNASLITYGTIIGTLRAQRYIESYVSGSDGWHLISSPVNSFEIIESDFDPGSGDDFYAWSESTNAWLNHKLPANSITHFNNGQAYLVSYESTQTKTFVGSPNTADITFSGLSFGDGGGWHLLGNPFTSALEWNTADWALSDVGGVAKLWDESAGNYLDISADDIIPSTNGFFIQVADASNSITIPSSARVHDSQNNYKNAETNSLNTLQLEVSYEGSSFKDFLRLGFRADATEGWDMHYDARKLEGNESAPAVWCMSQDEPFSSNFLPLPSTELTLPMYFMAGIDGEYQVLLEGKGSFRDHSVIVLEDVVEDRSTVLQDSTVYSFTATTTDSESRFLLHFKHVSGVHTQVNEKVPVDIYSHDNILVIRSQSLHPLKGIVRVYNLMGNCVFEDVIHNETRYSKDLKEGPGCYIVSFSSGSQESLSKIYIH